MKSVLLSFIPLLTALSLLSPPGLAFASGLAATTAISQMLKVGDSIICMDDLYGGTNRFFNRILVNSGIKVKMVDACDVSRIEAAIDATTKVQYVDIMQYMLIGPIC